MEYIGGFPSGFCKAVSCNSAPLHVKSLHLSDYSVSRVHAQISKCLWVPLNESWNRFSSNMWGVHRWISWLSGSHFYESQFTQWNKSKTFNCDLLSNNSDLIYRKRWTQNCKKVRILNYFWNLDFSSQILFTSHNSQQLFFFLAMEIKNKQVH